MISHKMSLARCPWCEYEMDGATGLNTEDKPKPGDITVCINCSSALQFDQELRLAKIEEKELRACLSAKSYAMMVKTRRLVRGLDRRQQEGKSKP